ncbi:MAG: 16S rRNA (adenine(1518)-N(6)/adenine(1519)-N(6))-dimethyltransferase RsmA [bacterium]
MKATEIKLVCQKYGIYPSKNRGQNFLVDDGVIDNIIKESKLDKNSTVLEVGPGLGVLTNKLIDASGRVIAVELDRKVLEYLRVEFISAKNLEIIDGDILRVKLTDLKLETGKYKVVANLPYNITSFFLRMFLEVVAIKPSEMILMVQKEVAERIVAKPGELSRLGVMAQFYSEPKILFKVGREKFWPAPEVDSAVVSFKIKTDLPKVDLKTFFRLVNIGFAAKRKQLQNNLSGGLKISNEEVKVLLLGLGLNEKIRAQDLSLDNWIQLAQKIKS